MPKKLLPTTPAGFGMNNARVIVSAIDGTQYPQNRRVAHCVGCNSTSFWVPNYAPNYCLGRRNENFHIQCLSCKLLSIIPANEFIAVERGD